MQKTSNILESYDEKADVQVNAIDLLVHEDAFPGNSGYLILKQKLVLLLVLHRAFALSPSSSLTASTISRAARVASRGRIVALSRRSVIVRGTVVVLVVVTAIVVAVVIGRARVGVGPSRSVVVVSLAVGAGAVA